MNQNVSLLSEFDVLLAPRSLEEALQQFNHGNDPAGSAVKADVSFELDDAYIFNLEGEGLTTTSK